MELVSRRFLSPAKINLMLRILNQRADGFHNLQTCFQLLEWGDEIHCMQKDCSKPNRVEVSGIEGVKLRHNLIFKAAQLLKPYAQNRSSWDIVVDKKIPLGAGLGGGSSNAAIILKFLNKHWQCGLTLNELTKIGVKLGADVPIFLWGKSALAGGVGELLDEMQFDTPYILLMFPQYSISTAELFAHNELQRDQAKLQLNRIQDSDFWINDFFPTVLREYKDIHDIYHQLKHKMNVRLSGTGSTMFALFDTQQQVEKAFEISNKICQSLITKPLRHET